MLRLHYLPYPEWTECSVQVVARLVLNSGFLNNNAPTNHLSIRKGALENCPRPLSKKPKFPTVFQRPECRLELPHSAHQPCNKKMQTALGRAAPGWTVSRMSAVAGGNQRWSGRERLSHPRVQGGNRPSDDQCSVRKFPGCRLFIMPTGD